MSAQLNLNEFASKIAEKPCLAHAALTSIHADVISRIEKPEDIDTLCNTVSYSTAPELAPFNAKKQNLMVMDKSILRAKSAYRLNSQEDFV